MRGGLLPATHITFGRAPELVKITFLGTAAAVPTRSRGLPCICVEREGELLMFDAGEGAQSAFARAGLGWNRKMSVFVTHLHGDHCLGLPGLIQTMSMRDRSRPLNVYGPRGTAEFVTANMRMLRFNPSFELVVRDVDEGDIRRTGGYSVTSCRADHTIRALSYLLREADRPGRFHPDRARTLGVPKGPLWKMLQTGGDVQVGGRTVRPSDVLGSGRAGLSMGYSGDTRPGPVLERFFAGCDCLIFDATFAEEHADRARTVGHSTAAGAARLARNAGAKRLILTHFSARYPDDAAHLAEARRIHPDVTAAADMMSVCVT